MENPKEKLKSLKAAASHRGSSLGGSIEAKEIRLQIDDEFERKNGYSYDYVFVFKVHDENAELSNEQKEFSMRAILQKLARSGIETKMFYSVNRENVFCKLRIDLVRIGKEADRIDYKVEFEPDAIQRIAGAGYPDLGINGIIIQDQHNVSHRHPFANIFARYDTEDRLQPAYKLYGTHIKSPFRGVDRIKILLSILQAHGNEGGAGLNLKKLQKDKCIEAAFPLHDQEELEILKKRWCSWRFMPWQQPIVAIKDYFGEKVGLYFAWLGHYTTWLIAPAIIGIAVSMEVFVHKPFSADVDLVPFFGIFMALWSTFYYEFWKRYNSTLALEWGMTSFEDEEVERPEFKGESIPSPVTGQTIRYFSPRLRFRRVMASLLFIFMLILLVIGIVAAIFLFRYVATHKNKAFYSIFTISGHNIGGPAASTLNAIQIQVMNNIYSSLAIRLNNYENHRTDTEYEDHLIGKTFLFQFVNSYASLFYIAFIKTFLGLECRPFTPRSDNEESGCMDELMMALGIIFVLRLTSGNFFEVGLPAIYRCCRSKPKPDDGSKREPSAVENQFHLDTYSEKGTFDDYNEMIIQFGYVTLFVVGFPLAPALALLNNFFEIRIDAHKLLDATKRPDPRGAQDIGTWGTIIEIMSTISVITNVAIVCFTSTLLKDALSTENRLILFIAVEHAMILLGQILSSLVNDEPQDVVIQKQRNAFIVDKIVNQIADDNDDVLTKGNQVRVDLTVFDEDT